MSNDLEKTIHYTTKASYICQNLIDDIPKNANLVEPFVGHGDLVELFPHHTWEKYDVDERLISDDITFQDTLLNVPNYINKWVITNPPFLAKNKAKDKKLFIKYQLDDLYKITLKTIIGCAGGILIIPTNFFTDENSAKIRTEFLSKYQILHINFFTSPVFITTTYSVCAFSFIKKNTNQQILKAHILPDDINDTFILDQKYDYRLAGEIFNQIEETESIFSRLTQDTPSNEFITNMKLYAIDTRQEHIHIITGEKPFVGKKTDRTYLTFTSKISLTDKMQEHLAKEFNKTLEDIRKKYHNMLFTNYRDYNRKRIGFNFAYKLLSKIYYESFTQL